LKTLFEDKSLYISVELGFRSKYKGIRKEIYQSLPEIGVLWETLEVLWSSLNIFYY